MGVLGPIWLSALVSIIAGTLTTTAVVYRRRPPAPRSGSRRRELRPGASSDAWDRSSSPSRRTPSRLLALLALAVAAVALLLSLAPGAIGGGPLAFVAILAVTAVLVAAVFVSIRWTFWPQAVMIDEAGPLGSLGRSWRLISGSTARVIGYALLFGLAAGIIEGLIAQLGLIVVSTVAGGLSEEVQLALRFAVSSISTLLLAPVVPVAMTLLYLDLRVRRGEPISIGA